MVVSIRRNHFLVLLFIGVLTSHIFFLNRKLQLTRFFFRLSSNDDPPTPASPTFNRTQEEQNKPVSSTDTPASPTFNRTQEEQNKSASSTDTRKEPPLEDLYWLDMKTVQLNQTQEEKDKLDEIILSERNDKNNTSLPFRRHDGVVIVTKIHWPTDIGALKRMFCLQKAAYNRFVNYDIVVFSTLPWTMEQVEDLGRVVAPARLTVANEAPSLEEQLAQMTHDEVVFLEERCHVNQTVKNLTWFHHCFDGGHRNNLAYSWQAEFRAYHIWTHPALRDYKYMIWLDADALCGRTWYSDPIHAMVQQDLILMFTTFYGTTKSEEFRTKLLSTYGVDLCWNGLRNGHMNPKRNCTKWPMKFRSVGGFFHITNLDVYREPRHQNFLKVLVGDYRFSRKWDDQIAVTVIPSMEDPERAWHLASHNFTLHINHHNKYDGVHPVRVANKKRWWTEKIRNDWHAGRLLCDYCF